VSESKVKIIDEMTPPKGPDYNPLNGDEFRQFIERKVHEALMAEHGLFSLARCWARANFTVEITLQCWGEKDQTITVEGELGNANAKGNPLGAKLTAEGASEPPDQVREQLGLPVATAEPKPPEAEFSQEVERDESGRPKALRVRRRTA
jgi:hypothetical protein